MQRLKIHTDHVTANIIQQFLRKLKMLSSTQMKETHQLHIQWLSFRLMVSNAEPYLILMSDTEPEVSTYRT